MRDKEELGGQNPAIRWIPLLKKAGFRDQAIKQMLDDFGQNARDETPFLYADRTANAVAYAWIKCLRMLSEKGFQEEEGSEFEQVFLKKFSAKLEKVLPGLTEAFVHEFSTSSITASKVGWDQCAKAVYEVLGYWFSTEKDGYIRINYDFKPKEQ